MYYYTHHIGDFSRDTQNLNDSQLAAYLRLIWLYYDTESALVNDAASLAFKIRASATDVQLLLDHYFTLEEDGMYHQKRCDSEIARFHGKSETGHRNAMARWKNQKSMQLQCNGNATASNSNATAMRQHQKDMLTNNQQPTTNINHKPMSEYSDEFAKFWAEYPRKDAKVKAQAAWKKQKPDLEIVLAALKIQKASQAWTKDDGQFIPMPTTYINGRRWEDQIAQPAQVKQKSEYYRPDGTFDMDRFLREH